MGNQSAYRARLAVLGLLLTALAATLVQAAASGDKPPVHKPVEFRRNQKGAVEWRASPTHYLVGSGISGWRGLLLGVPLDPNTAGREDWDALPGVGTAVAAEIMKARGRQGGFSNESGLLEAKGIGPKKLEAMMRWVRF